MQIYSIKGCKFRPHWNDIASLPYDMKDPSFVNWQDWTDMKQINKR